MGARHHFDDHTAEVRLRLEADSLGELFGEGARALAELGAFGSAAEGQERVERRVELRAPDREALLVDWLNEVIYLTEVEHALFGDAAVKVEPAPVDGAGGWLLSARLAGHRREDARMPAKAATFHELRVVEQGDRVSATVVLDV